MSSVDSTSPPAKKCGIGRKLLIVGIALVILGGAGMATRGTGAVTWAIRKVNPSYGFRKWPGKLLSSKPIDFSKNVPVDSTLTATFRVSFGTLDPASLSTKSVNLVRTYDQKVIPCAMDMADPMTLRLTPNAPLDPRTNYQVHINPHLTDTRAVQVTPYILSFDTAGPVDPAILFEKVALPTTQGVMFTAVVVGPDGKLWAGADDGRIFRFPIESNGTLGAAQIITTLKDHNKGLIPEYPNGDRLLIGFCFDPASTKENPIIWVTNGYPGFKKVPDLSGKITRMAGPNLEQVNDVIKGLPRSVKDHVTLQCAIGPDGALYFCNGSNSAMGAPDEIWGNRVQQPLCASLLRLDLSKIKLGEVLDAAPPYDANAKDAPLTVYAAGIRNAYDLVWHSNGHLYVPTNGSAAEGNTPAGPNAPGLTNVPIAEDDWLFDIQKGHYYGHPTGLNGHYILNGGNPTPEYDLGEVCKYPIGTKPDPAWTPAIYDFGQHVSANGVLEYQSNTFGGRMKNALIVCRYTDFYSDLIVLKLDKDGNVSDSLTGMKGMTKLNTPLDIAEDTRNGNIYVSEYGGQCITLLRAR